MSDSDLGGLGGTTPAPKSKAKATGKRVAGPSSSKPSSSNASKTKPKGRGRKTINVDTDDGEDAAVEETTPVADDVEMVEGTQDVPPTKVNGRKAPQATATKRTQRKENGARGHKPQAQEAAADDENELDVPSSALAAQVDKWKRRCEEAQRQMQDLSGKLEEILRVRNTEAEALLEQTREEYENALKVKDGRINELDLALNQRHPMLKTGKSDVLQLLTRETAENEQHALQEQIRALQEELGYQKALVREKEATERELRQELKMEIERAKSLASKANGPGSAQRATVAVVSRLGDDPKVSEVVQLYEDLTNLLVMGMRHVKSKWLGLDEWIMNCVYSYAEQAAVADERKTFSLAFSLQFCYDLKKEEAEPVVNKDQLIQAVKYEPTQLGQETEELVERLGYLATPFSFERVQLPLFLKSVHDKIGEALDSDQEDEDEDEEESMEVVDG